MLASRRPAAAIALIAGSLLALPTLAQGDAPRDHVVGGGQNNPPNGRINHFNFNVFGTGNADEATGKVKFDNAELGPPIRQYTASIACLRVTGNLASMVGVIDRTKNNDALEGRAVVIFIQDLSQGADGDDRIQNRILPAGTQAPACPDPQEPTVGELTRGNINVFDAG